MDEDGSGEITLREFYEHFCIEKTQFTDNAFSVLDTDGSGQLSALEFIFVIWNYCTMSWELLARFSFDLFDADGSGWLSKVEILTMVSMVYDAAPDAEMSNVIAKMDTDGSGTISREEFMGNAKRFPMLLFPAFQLQRVVREFTLGPDYWSKLERQREREHPDASLQDIIADAEQRAAATSVFNGPLFGQHKKRKKPEPTTIAAPLQGLQGRPPRRRKPPVVHNRTRADPEVTLPGTPTPATAAPAPVGSGDGARQRLLPYAGNGGGGDGEGRVEAKDGAAVAASAAASGGGSGGGARARRKKARKTRMRLRPGMEGIALLTHPSEVTQLVTSSTAELVNRRHERAWRRELRRASARNRAEQREVMAKYGHPAGAKRIGQLDD